MDDIPAPHVLDPHRVLHETRDHMTVEEHRSQAAQFATALDESCDYAQQLWNDLAKMRLYLHDSLPPEPSAEQPPSGASPAGPHGDEAWTRWINAFGEISTVLCGPRGDSGYGHSSAMAIARSRRQQITLAPQTHTETATPNVTPPTEPDAYQHDEADPSPVASWATTTSPSRITTRHQVVEPFIYGAVGAALSAILLRGKRGARQ